MSTEAEARHWTNIDPADATELVLPTEGIAGPINEMGELCPWPWEPQQLVNAPLGQYHCGYCGGMVVAGVPHTDFTGVDFDTEDPMEAGLPEPDEPILE